jgi:hypothetical protein
MTVAVPALSGVIPFGGRVAPRSASRRVARGIALGAGTAGTAVALTATAIAIAVWMVAAARPDNLTSQGVTARGPGPLALARLSPPPGDSIHRLAPVVASRQPGDAPAATFESKWALATIPEPTRTQPPQPALTAKSKTVRTKVVTLTPVSAPAPAPKRHPEIATNVPLPRTRPARHDIVHATPPAPAHKAVAEAPVAPVHKVATATTVPAAPAQKAAATPTAPAQKLAMATPPDTTGSIPRETPSAPHREPPQPVLTKVSRPTPGSRVAVYDISAGTVYLPSGEKLEAHSGLGDKMDDPRHVNVRMRGATPPNIYNLAMRESLFHGVAAIRLKPVHEDRMFGRDGILAHTYMLGANGQSNGCVSFKNYAAFLRAFQKGEFDRMIVVAKIGDPMPNLDNLPEPVRTARATPVRRWRVADSQPAATPRQHALTGQW